MLEVIIAVCSFQSHSASLTLRDIWSARNIVSVSKNSTRKATEDAARAAAAASELKRHARVRRARDKANHREATVTRERHERELARIAR